MIKFENVKVDGFEPSIRGLRNPKNSWAKSDSGYGCSSGGETTCSECQFKPQWCGNSAQYIIGPADKELMMKLNKGGPVHAKYRRQIVVWVDITMPTFVWAEFDTYKVGTVRNSCSFMHKGTSKPFEIVDFSFDEDEIRQAFMNICDDGAEAVIYINHYTSIWQNILVELNELRDIYLQSRDDRVFQMIRRLLPSGYNLKATISLNYEVLAAMYRDRKNHRLDEWRELCKWIETLPYSWIITGEEESK